MEEEENTEISETNICFDELEKMDYMKIVDEVCKKLKCSELAKSSKNKLKETTEIFPPFEFAHTVMETYTNPIHKINQIYGSECGTVSVDESDYIEEMAEEFNFEEFMSYEECDSHSTECSYDKQQNSWLGYFKGYEILKRTDNCRIGLNKKCIEISIEDDKEDLYEFIYSGVRCFIIDLSKGSIEQNETLVERFHEAELMVSSEFRFPITCTLVARLSPRLQFTGFIYPPDAEIILKAGDIVTVTTDRKYAARCTKDTIYINARFLLVDMNECDFIPIGYGIELCVKEVHSLYMKCQVVEGGQLSSRMPALFPRKCSKYRLSFEELEDITFAKEIGISCIVSYIYGSKKYLADLKNCLKLINCNTMQLGTRIVLNELYGCTDEIVWIAECYDNFFIELFPKTDKTNCELLELCPGIINFLKRAHELKKPILFDPIAISEKSYIVPPELEEYIFYYPDKYVVKSTEMCTLDYFHLLQAALFGNISRKLLCKEPFKDESEFGGDTLARNCVIASLESNVTAILLATTVGRLAIDISHFRPVVPILLITQTKSIGNYISLYHNVTMHYYQADADETYYNIIYKEFLFGIVYLISRNLTEIGDTLLLVYDSDPHRNYADKYVMLKITDNFVNHLKQILFI